MSLMLPLKRIERRNGSVETVSSMRVDMSPLSRRSERSVRAGRSGAFARTPAYPPWPCCACANARATTLRTRAHQRQQPPWPCTRPRSRPWHWGQRRAPLWHARPNDWYVRKRGPSTSALLQMMYVLRLRSQPLCMRRRARPAERYSFIPRAPAQDVKAPRSSRARSLQTQPIFVLP